MARQQISPWASRGRRVEAAVRREVREVPGRWGPVQRFVLALDRPGEGRRMLYTAVTRARDSLHLFDVRR